MTIDYTNLLKEFYGRKIIESFKDVHNDADYYRLLYIHIFTSGKYKTILEYIENKYSDSKIVFQKLLEFSDFIGGKYTKETGVTPREYLDKLLESGELEKFVKQYIQ